MAGAAVAGATQGRLVARTLLHRRSLALLRQAYISEETTAVGESLARRPVTTDVTEGSGGGLFYGAAVLMSLLGFSVSVFSLNKLQSAAPPKTLAALAPRRPPQN